MTIKLNYEKANEIDYSQFKQLNKFDTFISDCSKSQVIARMTLEQFEEALQSLEDGEDVDVVS